MTKILGLTGGIASGKTTVSNYFKELSIDVIDADIIAREVMEAGEPVVLEIANLFGEELLDSTGELNREELGKIIFNSDEKRRKLNHLVQGKIHQKIQEKKNNLLEQGKKMIVIDIPLLYEEGYEKMMDDVMVIYVDPDVQLHRLLNRNPHLSKDDALNRINSQMPLEEKAKRADAVIDNNETMNQTRNQVRNWLIKRYNCKIE